MTHTKESLEAMEPRELDALAHEVVFGEKPLTKRIPSIWRDIKEDELRYCLDENRRVPRYSASLDAAAVLEAELAERELHDAYLLALTATVHPEYILYSGMTVKQRFEKVTATAKARTIAAILTVQEAA